jgi:hypothetical protein
MKWREVRGAGNVTQDRDQKCRHFDYKPKWMGLFELIFKTFVHELCCDYIRLWENHVYGKTKNSFGWYGHVTVSGLCLADKVSDMSASRITTANIRLFTSN